MIDEDDRGSREDLRTRERIRYQWMLDSVSKVRLFFAGLVFAILAFSVQFAVASASWTVKGCQLAAWLMLILAGFLALREAGGLVSNLTEPVFDGLSARARRAMYWLFFLAVVLLLAARLIAAARPGG